LRLVLSLTHRFRGVGALLPGLGENVFRFHELVYTLKILLNLVQGRAVINL
jgi:hypothetical protein